MKLLIADFFCSPVTCSPFGQRTLLSTSFSFIMKEISNDNYEKFARRKITFLKIYILKLIYIYTHTSLCVCVCVCVCVRARARAIIWAPVLYGEEYLVFLFISLCTTSNMTYFPFSVTHKFSG
jgi:hypothetical protein